MVQRRGFLGMLASIPLIGSPVAEAAEAMSGVGGASSVLGSIGMAAASNWRKSKKGILGVLVKRKLLFSTAPDLVKNLLSDDYNYADLISSNVKALKSISKVAKKRIISERIMARDIERWRDAPLRELTRHTFKTDHPDAGHNDDPYGF